MTGGRAREPFSRRIGRLSSSATSTPRQYRCVVRTETCHWAHSPLEIRSMNHDRYSSEPSDEEPMGIVISRGSRAESTPRFAAYVWSQVGENTPRDRAPSRITTQLEATLHSPAVTGGASCFRTRYAPCPSPTSCTPRRTTGKENAGRCSTGASPNWACRYEARSSRSTSSACMPSWMRRAALPSASLPQR